MALQSLTTASMSNDTNAELMERLYELYDEGWISRMEKDEVLGDMEAVAELVKDAEYRAGCFDPDDYKTWPLGYVGNMADRLHDMRKDGMV